jgi:hypothetical protein
MKVCDFGPYHSQMIPPGCVVLTKKRNSVRRKLQLRAVKSPGWKNWTPVIVLGMFYQCNIFDPSLLTVSAICLFTVISCQEYLFIILKMHIV